jgi:hypothetical protein
MTLTPLNRGTNRAAPQGALSVDSSAVSPTGLGDKVHHEVRRFLYEMTDPSMAVGMAMGLTAFNGFRALIQPSLMRSSFPLFAKVPFVTRTTSAALATVPEVGVFWGSSKAIQAFTRPGTFHWDHATAAQEMSHLGMTLGFLKSFGFAFGGLGALVRKHSVTWLPHHPLAWNQSGMLAGIMASHGYEIAQGHRAPSDFSSFITDSLITLGQFNAGGFISQKLFPSLYRTNAVLQKKLAAQEQRGLKEISSHLSLDGSLESSPWGFAFAGPTVQAASPRPLIEINRSVGGGDSRKAPRKVQVNPAELEGVIRAASRGEGSAREQLRDWDIASLLTAPKVSVEQQTKVLVILTEFGNRQAAQELVNLAASNLQALYYWTNRAMPVRGVAREVLQNVGVRSLSLRAQEGDYLTHRVLKELAALGNGKALALLMVLGQGSHGPALSTLRELSERDPEFRQDFHQAIKNYALEVWPEDAPWSKGGALVFPETLSSDGGGLRIFERFSRYHIRDLGAGGELLVENVKGRTTVLLNPEVDRYNHPFKIGDRVILIPRLGGASPAGEGKQGLKKIELSPKDGIGQDLIALMGERPSLVGSRPFPGLDARRAAELESHFEEGSVIYDIPKKGLVLVKLESGATTIGDLTKVTPTEEKFYQFWKQERGFSSVDPKAAESAWKSIQERAQRLRLTVRFGKNHYFDPMGPTGGAQKVFENFGGQIVFLDQLFQILPDAFLKTAKLEAIRLNTDRVGAGKLSSYEHSRVHIFEGAFLGSRRNLAALLLHELGHATAVRYRAAMGVEQFPQSKPPPGADYLGDPTIPKPVREQMRRAHRTLMEGDALLGLDFAGGPLYRQGYQANHFSEFIADLHVAYVAAGPRLRAHIQSFPAGSEVRQAWEWVYQEIKDRIFEGREYGYRGVTEAAAPPPWDGEILIEVEEPAPAVGSPATGFEVSLSGETRGLRGGRLISVQSFSQQRGDLKASQAWRFRVEGVGADGALILSGEGGRTLIARGIAGSTPAQYLSVGTDVVLLPRLGGGSPADPGNGPPKGFGKRLPTGEDLLQFLERQKKPQGSSSIPPAQRRRRVSEKITGNFWVKGTDNRIQNTVHNIDNTRFAFEPRLMRSRYYHYIEGELSPGVHVEPKEQTGVLERLVEATHHYRLITAMDPFRKDSIGSMEDYLVQVALERSLLEKNQKAFRDLTKIMGKIPRIREMEEYFYEQGWLENYRNSVSYLQDNAQSAQYLVGVDRLPVDKQVKVRLAGYLATQAFSPELKVFRDPEFNFIRFGDGGVRLETRLAMSPEFALAVLQENFRKHGHNPQWLHAFRQVVERAEVSRVPFLYYDRLIKVLELSGHASQLETLAKP